jgi:DNA-binding MarR family transcriptional regulator
MGEALKRRIKQAKFDSPVQEAMLNLMVASDFVREQIDRVCSGHGLTRGQYNVLRILKGIYPEGHPRCEIAERMLERAPDVTRLVDRLEEQGLAERDRSTTDRRHSITRITNKGLALMDELNREVGELFQHFGVKLSRKDARELSRICEGIYEEK